jgi:hypothetical protein
MDGRAHPEGGRRTNQGHAIGSWDGDVLVVDTTLFEDHRSGNTRGLQSGPQKHVIERYQLNDDGTRILIELVLEDPEFLAEPFTINMEWDYAPSLELIRFGCETEQARRFTFQ